MRILLLAVALALTATWPTGMVAQTVPRSRQPIPAQQQADKRDGHFTLDWSLCFSDLGADLSTRIKGCDAALLSPGLSADDVGKLKARRAFLRIERELEIDSHLTQTPTIGGSTEAPPEKSVAATSKTSSLVNSLQWLFDKVIWLNREYSGVIALWLLALLMLLLAIDALKWVWQRLKNGADQANASANAPADFAQPPATSSFAERPPPGSDLKQAVQGFQSFKKQTEAQEERFQQAHFTQVASRSGGGGAMQLKLRRSQRSGGVVSSKVYFALDARADLSPEEKGLVSKYGLGKLVVYDSQARKKHQEAAYSHFDEGSVSSAGRAWWKNARGLASAAMMAFSLHVTVESLMKGHHIECKDLDELLGAEAAILNACKTLRAYLDTAQTFDGREEVLEF